MKDSRLALGALLGLGVYLLTREAQVGGDGSKGPNGGGVVLGGSVGMIKVDQAVMGSHMLSKAAGEIIKVTVPWNADTRDQNTKLLLPWPYWLQIRLGHSTVLGWKDATELGFGGGVNNNFSTPVTGLQSAFTQFVTPNDPNQTWDVHVRLYAREALPGTNLPTSDTTKWVLLPGMPVKHDGALVSWAAGVQLGGSVGAISVAQQRRHSVGRMGL